MQTVHGNHHRYRVSDQSYKESLKRRQSQLVLETVSPDEYVVTENGQYRCALCTNIPPFKNGCDLVAHLRGKRHQGRILNKTLQQTISRERKVTGASIAIPDILHRTREVTKRVLASNHSEGKRAKVDFMDKGSVNEGGRSNYNLQSVATQQATKEAAGSVQDEEELTSQYKPPQWIQEMEARREEELMLTKGFRKDENGKWYRDTTIEFDSDEEPTLDVCVP